MPSISSAGEIKKRTLDFCIKVYRDSSQSFKEKLKLCELISELLQNEYKIIPSKERIGKGYVYVSKHVVKALFQFLIQKSNFNLDDYYDLGISCFDIGERTERTHLQHFSLIFLAEYVNQFPDQFDHMSNDVVNFANNEKWEIRESTAFIIVSAMKKNPLKTLKILTEWTANKNANIRRLVSESLRPSSNLKWLRDPLRNDPILEILTLLRNDPSIYVRKSVGNNIKDLSKYMPQKILKLMKDWIEQAEIEVCDELATEVGLNTEQKRIIWTIKHGLRWLKKKNSEYFPEIEKILGKYYVLYFDEKRNRLAKTL
jgi:3-methyladenine DNA glycosylase AlkC